VKNFVGGKISWLMG